MADDLKTFTIEEARRIALCSQGFYSPRPKGQELTTSHIAKVVDRVKIIQIDSIDVLVRAQFMPFFSRLGPYPMELLHAYAYEEYQLFEQYVHAASLIPMEQYPLIRHRMDAWQPWSRWDEVMAEHPEILPNTIRDITARGPLEVSDIEDKGERYGHWSTTTAKLVLETMLLQGKLAVSDRINSNRRYDLIERVVPSRVLSQPTIPEAEAHQVMMKLALDALGVATAADCADYYRIKRNDATRALNSLTDAGQAELVKVEGVDKQMYAQSDCEPPTIASGACALLSPFDPLAWFRDRLSWLFGFEYRIEIYTPARKRKYGYYVLPFLWHDRIAARVDLKADRKASVLRVPGAFIEDGFPIEDVARDLAVELRTVADWLGLKRVVIGRRGNLVVDLRFAVQAI